MMRFGLELFALGDGIMALLDASPSLPGQRAALGGLDDWIRSLTGRRHGVLC